MVGPRSRMRISHNTLIWRRNRPYSVVGIAVVSIASGGAPYGATKRVMGLPNGWWGSMRTLPLGPSVELPMGPRNV